MLAQKAQVELPICSAVDQVLYHGADPRETVNALFLRTQKREF